MPHNETTHRELKQIMAQHVNKQVVHVRVNIT